MSIIQAYKSDEDGKIFESKEAYQRHLRTLSAARRRERKRADRENLRLVVEEKMRTECGSFTDLADFILKHWGELRRDTSVLQALGFSEMRWSESVSNTHDCPRGGVTNWWSKEDLPTGYPGWKGRIYLRQDGATFSTAFQKLDYLNIYTGSGGGGHYEVRLFAADFPGLTKDIMWKKLSK